MSAETKAAELYPEGNGGSILTSEKLTNIQQQAFIAGYNADKWIEVEYGYDIPDGTEAVNVTATIHNGKPFVTTARFFEGAFYMVDLSPFPSSISILALATLTTTI